MTVQIFAVIGAVLLLLGIAFGCYMAGGIGAFIDILLYALLG